MATASSLFTDYPSSLAIALRRIARMSDGAAVMRSRASAFASPDEMALAGVAIDPRSRAQADRALSRWFATATVPYGTVGEVIIGAGPSAAVYATARVAAGFPKPLVLERSTRPGGAFAVSERPSFYLNSEGRPGVQGFPRDGDALNVLPGAPIQPSMVTRTEFPTNADVAWTVRVALARSARVVTGAEVAQVYTGSRPYEVTLTDGRIILANRVIDARGLGDPAPVPASPAIQTAPQFMASLDQPFPFQGLRKVAIIGDGDYAKVVAEALVGIGPMDGMGPAALDGFPRIDWYAPSLPIYREDWREAERGRYLRLSSYLPSRSNSAASSAFHDVTVIRSRAEAAPTVGGALVQGNTYDRVIYATGLKAPLIGPVRFDLEPYSVGGLPVALNYPGRDLYVIGPACDLDFTSREVNVGVADVAANKVALFRSTPRTAVLATSLPDPSEGAS
jgi:hypothetical protein